jgi:hypothetical protein
MTARNGREQLYDRQVDPFQMVNLAMRTEYQQVLEELRRRTVILKDCAGAACAQPFAALPDPGPLLEPLPKPVPPSEPEPVTQPESPVVPVLRAALRASDTRLEPRERLTLRVKASGRIESVSWLKRNTAGNWREVASAKGSGTRMVLRTSSLSKPGKQRFKASVVLEGGEVSSKQVVITTISTKSTRRDRG